MSVIFEESERRRDSQRKARATHARNEAERRKRFQAVEDNFRRMMAASLPQMPLGSAECEELWAEVSRNEGQVDLIERLLASRRRLQRALFEWRTPSEKDKALFDEVEVGAKDLTSMMATSLGVAEDIGDGMIKFNAADLFGNPSAAPDDDTDVPERIV